MNSSLKETSVTLGNDSTLATTTLNNLNEFYSLVFFLNFYDLIFF